MNCAVYKTNASECMGDNPKSKIQNPKSRPPGCLNRERPGEAWQPGAFTAHILRLDRVKNAGANFALSDLTPSDWIGLEALAEWRNGRQSAVEPHGLTAVAPTDTS